jgi:hypothetical protein
MWYRYREKEGGISTGVLNRPIGVRGMENGILGLLA